MSKIKLAFTLAEVLITLGIIGVVAGMTIPTLMNNFADAQYKTGYKKAFSIASQAWISALADDKIESRPSWSDAQTKVDNFEAFKTYFKITTDCSTIANVNCWADGERIFLNQPDKNSITDSFIDNSGTAWSLLSNDNNSGANILVDINGFRGPNKFGQDRFDMGPLAIDGNPVGLPVKIFPQADKLSRTVGNCPSGDTHPCYYTSWLYN